MSKWYAECGVTVATADWGALADEDSSPMQLIDNETGRRVSTGLGFHHTDIELFLAISESLPVKSVFIIGNAFGWSTFVLAEVFKGAIVDAIDAETEGDDSRRGSELTRRIAGRHYPGVRLSIGFSPQDVPKAVRPSVLNGYDVIFVDGLHTNEQQLKDFHAMLPYLAKRVVIVFHDVGLVNMRESFRAIAEEARSLGFDTFIEAAPSTVFGLGVIGRGVTSLAQHLDELPPVVERLALQGKKAPLRLVNEWLAHLDQDRDGRVSLEEFVRGYQGGAPNRQAYLDRLLQLADGDHDGQLRVEELREAVRLKR